MFCRTNFTDNKKKKVEDEFYKLHNAFLEKIRRIKSEIKLNFDVNW